MKTIHSLLALTAMAFLAVLIVPVQGTAGELGDNVSISVFGHEGRIQTDTNSYIVHESSEGSFSDYSFGMVLTVNANDRLTINSQIFATSEEFHLDWGFANVELSDQISFRAGLVKIPLGFYGETQNVRFFQPFAFLPQAAYASEMEAYFGGGFFANINLNNNWSAEIDIYGGEINLTHEEDAEEEGKNLYGFRGMLNLPISGAAVGGSYLSLDIHEDGEILPLKIWMFSAEVVGDKYFVRSETGRFDHEGITNWSYVEGGYSVSPKIQPVARYVSQKRDEDDPLALAAMALIGQTEYQNEFALGVNYHMVPELVFKMEHHFISGTGQLHDEELEEVPGKESWGLTSFSVAFAF